LFRIGMMLVLFPLVTISDRSSNYSDYSYSSYNSYDDYTHYNYDEGIKHPDTNYEVRSEYEYENPHENKSLKVLQNTLIFFVCFIGFMVVAFLFIKTQFVRRQNVHRAE
jgi:hypothetical protein